jgi:hypothetical protein
MPAIERPMPEIFHMIKNAFEKGTKPVKSELFESRNRLLIASSTGSGNINWITNKIMPMIRSQPQCVPEVALPPCFLNPIGSIVNVAKMRVNHSGTEPTTGSGCENAEFSCKICGRDDSNRDETRRI